MSSHRLLKKIEKQELKMQMLEFKLKNLEDIMIEYIVQQKRYESSYEELSELSYLLNKSESDVSLDNSFHEKNKIN